jgi:exopolysaccharide biosynthesis protein
MKQNILSILGIFSICTCFPKTGKAQMDTLTQTQMAFQNAAWKIQLLDKAVVWATFHFQQKEIFNANENIHILKFNTQQTDYKPYLRSAGDSLVRTSQLAKSDTSILAAINGTFFDMKKGGSVDFIKIANKILDTSRLTKNKLAEHQLAAIAFDSLGNTHIIQGDSLNPKWANQLPYPTLMVTGPLLLKNGKPTFLRNVPFNYKRHPRSCICVTEQNETIWMTIDGRTTESQGVSLIELTLLSQWLGCKDAINLDGGGSTTLYVKGQPDEGVVNMPCDNHLFDHSGERPVSNIIVLKPKTQ